MNNSEDNNHSSTQAAKDLRDAVGSDTDKAISATEQKAHDLKQSAMDKAGQLRDYAGDKASQLGDKANHLKDAASEKAHNFKDSATDSAQHIKSAAQGQWDDTRVRAHLLRMDSADYVRENPTQSILAAVGVGFVLGLLMRK